MASLLIQALEWDTSFFGVHIGRVIPKRLDSSDMPKIMEWCIEKGIECLYFLCAPDHDESVQLAETYQFHLVDIRVEMVWHAEDKRECEAKDDRASWVRDFRDEDKPYLLEIANRAYCSTRFYYDRHFTNEQARKLYQEWVNKSCDGFADAVLVALRDDRISGFITCHLESPGRGRIGLVGVRSDLYNLGIGELLVRSALAYFARNCISEIRVVTQGRNLGAQRLYQKCGFCSDALFLWYHKWFRGF
jgi:dTDP-4-amino-4,6-dideoxy-D-galactose acyltransferase